MELAEQLDRAFPPDWHMVASAQLSMASPSQGAHLTDTDAHGSPSETQAQPADDDDEELADEEEVYENDSEVDDTFDKKAFGIYQALPVEGEPDWDMAEPDAEEYIRRVRWEAARCPQVVRADIDPAQFDDKRTMVFKDPEPIPQGPEWAQPDFRWVRHFLTEFEALRMTVAEQVAAAEDAVMFHGQPASALPHIHDLQTWDRICFGPGAEAASNHPPGPPDPHGPVTVLSGPALPTVVALDSVSAGQLLVHHVELLQQLDDVSQLRCQWLFALAARVERPVDAELGAAMRLLLRKCCQLRAGLMGADDELLPRLNILIAISGAYFRQAEDLAHYVDRDLF